MKKDTSGLHLMSIVVFMNAYVVLALIGMSIFCYQTGNPAWKLELMLLVGLAPIQIPLMTFLVFRIKDELKECREARAA